jgi:hypothetical protein
MQGGPRLKDLIPTDGLLLLRRRHRAMTIWIFPLSSAARPTDPVHFRPRKKALAHAAGAFVFATIGIVLCFSSA